MCGIVGYVGKKNCVNYVLDGLKHLEYRGYDSAGIAFFENNEVKIIKKCGKLDELIKYINSTKKIESNCAIGHTRWATHGKPSNLNSHPHKQNKVTVVHNGIIENYEELKEILKEKGYYFKTQTDTEVVAALLDYYYKGNPIKAIEKLTEKLDGSYSLGILFSDIKDTVFGTRKNSPLIVGVGDSENFLASDIPAIIKNTRKYIVLEKGEIAILKKDSLKIVDFSGKEKEKKILTINWDIEAAEKNGFPHFMLKEIFEQPQVIKKCFRTRLSEDDVDFEIKNLPDERIKQIKKIHIVACGTAMHAGLVGKNIIENLVRIPVEVEVASEFRYKNPILNKDDLVILISQSGETADTLAALRLAKEKNVFTLAIVNVVSSSIARESDSVLYTWAGPEISVASTKAYSVQLACLYLLTIKFAKIFKTIEKEKLKEYCEFLNKIPDVVNDVLKLNDKIKNLAKIFYNNKNMFYIGRGLDQCLALEGSLKLKELSYIHSEAYAAGELKHGPISLIEEKTPVVAILTQTNLSLKTISNIKEVIARGADVFLIYNDEKNIDSSLLKCSIKLPKTIDLFSPLYSIIPLQLFAYHIAVLKKCDVDKPRNLAKSVTVE